MLKVKSFKKLLIVVLAVMLIVAMQTGVKATGPIVITGNNMQTIPTLNSITSTTTNPTNKPTITTTTNTINTTNTVGTTNSKLPNAGLDYSVLFVIVACVMSGVYAYVKIKEYNSIKY